MREWHGNIHGTPKTFIKTYSRVSWSVLQTLFVSQITRSTTPLVDDVRGDVSTNSPGNTIWHCWSRQSKIQMMSNKTANIYFPDHLQPLLSVIYIISEFRLLCAALYTHYILNVVTACCWFSAYIRCLEQQSLVTPASAQISTPR